MYNLAPQPNLWEGMSLDQINDFKDQCQSDMPLVELMSVKADPDSCAGLERDQTLRIMGYDWNEIEALTGFKRRTEPRPLPESIEANQIRFYGKEIWEKMKAYEKRAELEWKLEYDQILNNGIRLGFVEEEVGREPKL